MKLSKKIHMFVTPNGKTHLGTYNTHDRGFGEYLSCTGEAFDDFEGGHIESIISDNLTCSECASKLKKAAKELNNLIK